MSNVYFAKYCENWFDNADEKSIENRCDSLPKATERAIVKIAYKEI